MATATAFVIMAGLLLTGADLARADVAYTQKTLLWKDSFRRDVADGWGTAHIGGRYRAEGARAGSVHAGHGVMLLRPGVTAGQVAGKAAVRDGLVSTSIRLSKVPTGGAGTTVSLTLRSHGKSSYRARTRIATSGRVYLSIYRIDKPGAMVKLAPTHVVMAGLQTTDTLHLEFVATGFRTVNLSARAWTEGSPEPDWQVTGADRSTSRLREAGGAAVRTYLAAGSEALKVLFDDFAIWSVKSTGSVDGSSQPAPSQTPGSGGSGVAVGAASTGVPTGTQLTVHEGDLTVTTPGTVIDGLDIRGFVTIAAPNVTIENSVVRGRAGSKPLVDNLNGQPGLRITDSELFPMVPSPDAYGIMGYNFTLTRVNVHGVIDAVHITGNNVTVEDSWLHDNLHYASDPNFNGAPSHDDSIQIQVGSNIRVTGSNISGAFNSGMQITQDRGPVSNLTVSRNFMDGGGCTINIAEKSYGPVMGVSVSENTFGRDTRVSDCAVIAKATTHVAMVGNYYSPDGALVTVHRG